MGYCEAVIAVTTVHGRVHAVNVRHEAKTAVLARTHTVLVNAYREVVPGVVNEHGGEGGGALGGVAHCHNDLLGCVLNVDTEV